MIRDKLYRCYVSALTKFGDLYFALEPPACRMKNIEELFALALPGDIIVRGYDAYVDGKFIPGEYSHSGVVINSREVIHSIAEGIQSIHLGDFVIDTDRFMLLRPPYKTKEDCWQVVERAIWYCDVRKPGYDFSFKIENDDLYCHEFSVSCLRSGGIEIPLTEKSFGVWPFRYSKKVYLADSFIRDFEQMYVFNPK